MMSVPQPTNNSRRRKQAGSALMMVIFAVATMLLLSTTAVLRIDTQGRREREAELAWRGEQYQHAIGKYFRKFGKYPTKIDDLVKQTNGVRFLRQAYTDPLNKEDGSWRFIYAGPGGQLIGSLRRMSLLQSVVATPLQSGAGTLGASTSFGAGGNTSGSANGFGQSGQMNSAQGFNPGVGQPQSLGGAVIGGNIVGVASKVKEPSLRVYDGGDTYEMWEFISNVQTQGMVPGTTPIGPTGPTSAPGIPMNAPGQSPLGGPAAPPATDAPGGGTRP